MFHGVLDVSMLESTLAEFWSSIEPLPDDLQEGYPGHMQSTQIDMVGLWLRSTAALGNGIPEKKMTA